MIQEFDDALCVMQIKVRLQLGDKGGPVSENSYYALMP